MEPEPTAGAAEEGAPERPALPERDAARGDAQPEPEPVFCEPELAEPEPERVQVAWDCAGATKEAQLIFLSAGDVVQIVDRPKPGWVVARKELSGERGLVPEIYFRELESMGAKPEPEPPSLPSFVVAGPHEQRHWD
eukprot:COSAG04_NODE_6459_length_1322_cov_1.605887_1_plen_136_part_10